MSVDNVNVAVEVEVVIMALSEPVLWLVSFGVVYPERVVFISSSGLNGKR